MKNNIRQYIHDLIASNLNNYPAIIRNLIVKICEKILYLNEISTFLEYCGEKSNLQFIDELFDYLDFSYFVSSKDKFKIPAEGKLIIVANHPLGALDSLALIKAVSEVRKDIKIVANEVLTNLQNINGILLPYNVYSFHAQKEHIMAIEKSLLKDEVVIFFPAAEVSRFTWKGIKDRKWQNGAVRFAEKFEAPILPVFIDAKNSSLFYGFSLINKRLSTFLLPREIFCKRGKSITLKIGDPIPGSAFKNKSVGNQFQTTLLRKHVYRLEKGKTPVFATEQNIIHPIPAKLIKMELNTQKLLLNSGKTKKIFLVDFKNAENVGKEISRLRELTFRKVGEGTGRKSDFDKYDYIYKHIVLWDEEELEIMGSYRLGICSDILIKYGMDALYNNDHFLFSNNFKPILSQSLELGRSFIQQRYWRSNALDLLWQGIGAYLQMNPEVKYLFGAVSISNSYSDFAKSLIVTYYRKWYQTRENFAIGKRRFVMSKNMEEEVNSILTGSNYLEDFKNLKQTLKAIGFSIPVLFRKYADLCDYDGVKFLDFNTDPDFSNSVDGLMLMDLQYLKPEFIARYYNNKSIMAPENNVLEAELV